MKTEWDYTELANAYLQRPDYSNTAIDAMIKIANLRPGDLICDVGAGVAHLTIMLANRNYKVVAVEPNDAMRVNGIKRTSNYTNVLWKEGTGENTNQEALSFSMVTFGSSFNVCDRDKALKETARILKPYGWIACMWNHRVLDDPLQSDIEKIIKTHIKSYGYGTRREDQTEVINNSKLFGPVIHLDSSIIHEQSIDSCIEAWKSHATLQRQAGDNFFKIINDIENYLKSLKIDKIIIPYSTNIWIAQLI
jgi:ubiquinone/menaquinone biosynthesis C-methylase UbiE